MLGLASSITEHALLAQGTMIGAMAGLATSLGDACRVCSGCGHTLGCAGRFICDEGARVGCDTCSSCCGCVYFGCGACRDCIYSCGVYVSSGARTRTGDAGGQFDP